MSCLSNPSPDSAKVWLLPLPVHLSLHVLRFIHGLFIFFNRGFLSIFSPSIPRLYTTPQFSLLYATSLFAFCFVFPIPLCSAPTPTFTYARAPTTPDKNHNLQWHMFQIHVPPRPLSTVHDLPLLSVTSFWRNYYGGQGRRARSLHTYNVLQRRRQPRPTIMCISHFWEGRLEGGRGGRTHLLLALVIWPLTTHPFRDGAPFLLLIDTSNIWGLITLLPYIT